MGKEKESGAGHTGNSSEEDLLVLQALLPQQMLLLAVKVALLTLVNAGAVALAS